MLREALKISSPLPLVSGEVPRLHGGSLWHSTPVTVTETGTDTLRVNRPLRSIQTKRCEWGSDVQQNATVQYKPQADPSRGAPHPKGILDPPL